MTLTLTDYDEKGEKKEDEEFLNQYNLPMFLYCMISVTQNRVDILLSK